MKITPFLIVFGIVEIILLIVTINYLFIDNKGGMALAGTISFVAAVINLLILTAEQAMAKSSVNKKVLWFVEIIIILILGIFVLINGISIG